MIQITIGNKIYYTSSAPNYVKKKISTGAWIKATKEEAEGVAVDNEVYSLPNKPQIDDRPVAIIKEIDGGTVIFEMSKQTSENALKVVDIQEALCDLSEQLEALANG